MRAACLNMIYELAKRDPRVVFIGSDLGPGVLAEMQHNMPERYFMEGIAEANVVGMAAGMAMDGFLPYVNTIATFLTRRCYEQVAVDLCMHDLPVRLVGNGGGLVYAPLGPTHLAIEDIAIMRTLPNMTVVAVCDAPEMTRLMNDSLDWPHPLYIRLAKGGDPVVSDPANGFRIGKAIELRRRRADRPVALMATGVMSANCLAAAAILERAGIEASVLHVHTVKPLDEEAVLDHARLARLVVTVEEGVAIGGFGSAVTDVLTSGLGHDLPPLLRIALPDEFPAKYGVQSEHFALHGLNGEGIAQSALVALRAKHSAG